MDTQISRKDTLRAARQAESHAAPFFFSELSKVFYRAEATEFQRPDN
jgi:hypothetical protein